MRIGGLIAAVVVAALAAVIVLRFSANDQPQPAAAGASTAEQTKTKMIYVAATAIPVGSIIKSEMVIAQPWPEQLVLGGFVPADGSVNIVGMVARASFQQSEPIVSTKLANPNDPNFLAGDLPKGMRVVTIPTNETDGVAGFVFPGDHVDLIFTHDVDAWEYPPAATANTNLGGQAPAQKVRRTVTETLLTNVKVLAVDQRSSSVGATDKDGNLIIPRSASLMVSQADAQRVRLAQRSGTVSLVLRALADKESADPLVLTQPTDISQAKQNTADGVSGDTGIKIIRGAPKSDKETSDVDANIARGAASATGVSPVSGAVAPVSATRPIVNPGLVAVP